MEEPTNTPNDGLIERLTELELLNRGLGERVTALEQRLFHVARMLAASQRLHRARTRAEVHEAILEVVINVLGSEEAGLFVRDLAGGLELVSSVGSIATQHPAVAADDPGALAECARSGRVYVAASEPRPPDLWACVPLRGRDRVEGVVAVFRLLPQKAGLDERDRELLEVLADQGGHLYEMAAPRGATP